VKGDYRINTLHFMSGNFLRGQWWGHWREGTEKICNKRLWNPDCPISKNCFTPLLISCTNNKTSLMRKLDCNSFKNFETIKRNHSYIPNVWNLACINLYKTQVYDYQRNHGHLMDCGVLQKTNRKKSSALLS